MHKTIKPLFLVFAAACSSGLGAAEFNFRMHQFLPLTAAIPKHFLQPWAAAVEKASQGRIKITHYPSMQLGGKPPALISQVTDGVVDFAWTLTGYTPGRFPRSEAVELPFVLTNGEATSRAFYEYYEPFFEQEFPGLKIIAVHVHGPGVIHSRKRVRSLADMKGLKLRGPTRTVTDLLKAAGASPVGMPVPRIPQALSKSVIDGAVIPWEVTLPLKTNYLVKYHTEFSGANALYTAAFVFAMNRKSYDRLPPDLKKVIDDHSGSDISAWAGRAEAGEDAPGRAQAISLNNVIDTISGDELRRWHAIGAQVRERWFASMQAKGIDGRALYQRLRALIATHSQ